MGFQERLNFENVCIMGQKSMIYRSSFRDPGAWSRLVIGSFTSQLLNVFTGKPRAILLNLLQFFPSLALCGQTQTLRRSVA